MNELALTGAVALLMLAAGAAVLLPWDVLLQAGLWLSVAGLAFGVPTGLVYHVLLYRALAPRGALPKGWIWRPITLHDALTRREARRVLPWAYAGGAGFGVVMLGFVAFALSVGSVVVRGV